MQRWMGVVCGNDVLMRDEEVVRFIEGDPGYSPVYKRSQPATGVRRKVIKQFAPPPDDTPELAESRPIIKRFYLGAMDAGQKVDKAVKARRRKPSPLSITYPPREVLLTAYPQIFRPRQRRIHLRQLSSLPHRARTTPRPQALLPQARPHHPNHGRPARRASHDHRHGLRLAPAPPQRRRLHRQGNLDEPAHPAAGPGRGAAGDALEAERDRPATGELERAPGQGGRGDRGARRGPQP